ncbi:transposase [Martelella sp. FLE1502]
MTEDMMNLCALVEKSADADLLRKMIGFAAEKLMALEVSAKTGAGYGEKNAFRLAQRNGYRDRDWETRAGTVELSIPKLRTGRATAESLSEVRSQNSGLFTTSTVRTAEGPVLYFGIGASAPQRIAIWGRCATSQNLRLIRAFRFWLWL